MPKDAITEVLGKRAPKTARGRRILKKREPQIVENDKTALVMRGNKCSAEAMTLLRELFLIRSPLSVMFSRPHPEHPFEDHAYVEKICNQNDHGLFVFGSTSKKRPFRLIFGRLFDGHLLDMQEFDVKDYKSMKHYRNHRTASALGAKPLIVFQGSAFDSDEGMKRCKSLLMDYFNGSQPERVMLQGLEDVVVCSAMDSSSGSSREGAAQPGAAAPSIVVRRYHINMSKSGSKLPRVELEESGPRFTLVMDRSREPDKERWKQAIKVPKGAKPGKEKNVKKDYMGKRSGKIHLGKQDFHQIHTVHHGKEKEKQLAFEVAKQRAGKAN